MKKPIKDFMVIAVIAAILLVVIIVFADEGTIRSAANAIIDWIAVMFGLPAPTIF